MNAPLTSWHSVDPERLRITIAQIPDSELRSRVDEMVENGYGCLSKLQTIDFSALERAIVHSSPTALWKQVEDKLAATWLDLENLQAGMNALADAYAPQPAEEQSELDDDPFLELGLSDDAGAAQEGTQTPPSECRRPAMAERVAETAWAMAFVLGSETQNFRGRLPTLLKSSDGWQLVTAVQDHVGHLRSAINALITGIFSSLPHQADGQADGGLNLELVASRELRQRLFALRDAVLEEEARLNDSPPGQWQTMLQRVVAQVEQFVFGPAFAWMRAGDKRSFLNHREELKEILALWSPLRATPAQQAVSGLARHLEALEVINQRECLLRHDKAALETMVRNLERAKTADATTARESVASAVAALAEAQGRDKELDRLLASTLDPSRPVPKDELLARAQQVLSRM